MSPTRRPGFAETVTLLALLISLVALSIDAMLPAFPDIAADFRLTHENDVQHILTAMFLGLSLGQLVFGPLSDSLGRRRAILLGLLVYGLGTALCLLAHSFWLMLAGRFIQGLGAAGPRAVSVALVRDEHEGAAMARLMSFIMGVFILVPIVAPALGQVILALAGWRTIFAGFLLLAVLAGTWFALRQPETLAAERRRPLSVAAVLAAARETVGNRQALGHTLAAGLVYGALVGYLDSAQQIFQGVYGTGSLFPAYFAAFALSLGLASLVNGRLVLTWGMTRLVWWSLLVLCVLSAAFAAGAWLMAGRPPLWLLASYLLAAFFCLGIQFGNLNALALQPLGHVAGTAAAVVGSLTTLMSLALGGLIGQAFDGTVLPMVLGFAGLALGALASVRWAGVPLERTPPNGRP